MSLGEIIYLAHAASEADVALTEHGMNAISASLDAPVYEVEHFTLQMRHGDKATGHLMGKVFWNWMYVDMLWVEIPFQKSGIGTQLMARAEDIARERKLTGIYCWTQSWQAPGFYRKLGFEECVRFDDFPPGHTRFGFRKYL